MRTVVSLSAVLLLAAGVALADGEKKDEKPKDKGKALAGKMFEKMDADADGKVSKEEFKKASEERLKDKGKGDKAGEFMARLFDKADADADGFLNKEEFAKMAELLGDRGKLKEKLKEKKKKKSKDD
ncbi:MAG: EF-hand domain-containing protein [Gemmataceae bacterium]